MEPDYAPCSTLRTAGVVGWVDTVWQSGGFFWSSLSFMGHQVHALKRGAFDMFALRSWYACMLYAHLETQCSLYQAVSREMRHVWSSYLKEMLSLQVLKSATCRESYGNSSICAFEKWFRAEREWSLLNCCWSCVFAAVSQWAAKWSGIHLSKTYGRRRHWSPHSPPPFSSSPRCAPYSHKGNLKKKISYICWKTEKNVHKIYTPLLCYLRERESIRVE